MSWNSPQGTARLSFPTAQTWWCVSPAAADSHGWAVLRWFLNVSVCAAGFLSLPLLFFPLMGMLKTHMTQTPSVSEQGEGSWSPQSHEVRGAATLTNTGRDCTHGSRGLL